MATSTNCRQTFASMRLAARRLHDLFFLLLLACAWLKRQAQ
jgi:hypothetical protein